MERRKFIATTCSSIAALSLSGCSGGSQEATEHLNAAYDALDTAGDEIKSESEKIAEADYESGNGVDFRSATILSHLDTASEELDSAEETASAEQQRKVEAARSYVSFGRAITELLDVAAEGLTALSAGSSHFENQQFGNAKSSLEKAESKFEESVSQLNTVQTRLDDLDKEPLSEEDSVSLVTVEDNLDKLGEMLPALEGMSAGMKETAVGMITFQEGATALDTRDLETAREKFSAAKDRFADAHDTFSEHESTAPAKIQSSFITLVCVSDSLETASQKYVNAVDALSKNRNEQAQEYAQEANEAIDECNY